MHISNRKQFAERALKMIAFVLLTVLLLVGMSKTLVPRSNSRQQRHAQLQSQRVLWGRKGFSGCGGYRQQ